MSKIRDEISKITKELERHRLRVGGKMQTFIPRPYPMEIEETIDKEGVEGLFHPSGLLVKNGHPVFVYIRDHTTRQNIETPRERNKLHFSFCGKLQQMLNENRFESRYRITNRTDDRYIIDYSYNKEFAVELHPCQLCLRSVNYRFFRWAQNEHDKYEIIENFNAKEAIELLNEKLDIFYSRAKKLRPDHLRSGYAHNHKRVSREYRISKNFTCEKCGVILSAKPHLTDMHHIDGDKSRNKPENLQCLCKLCHKEIHPHYHVREDEAADIEHLRKVQNAR